MSDKLQKLIERATQFPPLSMAVVDVGERHVMEGVAQALERGLIEPVFVGIRQRIEQTAEQVGVRLDGYRIVEAIHEEDAARQGVELAAAGEVTGLMKGWLHTDVLIHPVLARLRTERRLSHVFVVELASYHKLLFVTDAAINIEPALSQKAAIVQNAVDLARVLGVSQPKVAALSAVEVVKPEIASTVEAACLSKMAQRGQIRHALVDGPLAFDNAISREAAETKQIESDVAGDVDILLAPDMNSGNILAKDLEYLAGAVLAGVVIGAKVPIVLPSRSDPPAARLASVAVASIMHQCWTEVANE
ncbi:bifunctional enoyl-CoA hydratase/phosphate acetyltransferase [Gimesia algae]|uniref:Phosphate acetyltransferase n=1 Tax=Gimesia algae TaxID=2527971 RepID=A0A517VKS3_9PLAN|nr:bifunctional enoyl-CoA hydratase/phosphate acetyltransferase [Gimesia algae]QDT93619.1 Phosphate acetyltransferase [Gimesia algae]